MIPRIPVEYNLNLVTGYDVAIGTSRRFAALRNLVATRE
jgi:hypothetical protein